MSSILKRASVDSIRGYMDRNFGWRTLKKGKKYFEEERVEDLELINSKIHTHVFGSEHEPYEVFITLNTNLNPTGSSCNCPVQSYCKHEAAALYAFIDEINGNSASSDPVVQAKFKNRKSEVYRKLEFQNNLRNTLSSYMPRNRYQLPWYERVAIKIREGNTLQFYTISESQYHKYESQSVTFKFSKNEIWLRCDTCSERTHQYCMHQAILIYHSGEALIGIGLEENNFDLDRIKQNFVKEKQLTTATFDRYYDLFLGRDGFQVVSKENVVNKSWLNNVNAIFRKKDIDFERKLQKKNQKKLEGRPSRYAFLWTSDDAGNPNLNFINGYGLKTKAGIHSVDKEIRASSSHLPQPFQDLGNELKIIEMRNDYPRYMQEAKTAISKHLVELEDIYQYIGSQDRHGAYVPNNLHLFVFRTEVLKCTFLFELNEGHVHFTRNVTLGDENISLEDFIHMNVLFSIRGDCGYLNPNEHFFDLMNLFGEDDTKIFLPEDMDVFLNLLHHVKEHFKVEVVDEFLPEEVYLENPSYQIYLKEAGDFILFEPKVVYHDFEFNPLSSQDYKYDDDTDTIYKPQESDQRFILDFIRKSHPSFDQGNNGKYELMLDFKALINNYWFAHFVETCEATGIILLGQKELKNFNYSTKKPITVTHVKSGLDWFDVNMSIAFGKETVKSTAWIKAIRNKETYVTLKDGTLGILPSKWLNQVKKIIAVADHEKGEFKISKYRFNIIDDLFENIDDEQLQLEIQEKKKKLLEFDHKASYKTPRAIKAKLRDYQEHGYQWLKFLDEIGFGGILADDMGLGKTLQIICLLADQKKKKGTSLVVVPRTLLYNWSAELDKFCPTLKYVIHHGSERIKELKKYNKLDIIISTYGTVTSDIEKFKDYKLNYLILDESQAIKNPNSQRYKAIRTLSANNRIAMTGTPIENNTMDLYAQLSFTSPGLLGTKNHFKQNFAIPIDNHRNVEAAQLLRKMIHPFMLRRTKDQVAKDLPDKTESVIYCEMGEAQRKLYDTLRQKVKDDVHQKVKEDGVAKSKFFMLDGLLRLRQMCNSPLLINEGFQGASAESIKIKMLIRYLTEDIVGHSALVFSQFVSLLTLVRKELDQRKIPYAYLDGSTRNRQGEVDKFMNNDNVQVFLISIKAGNTGMNLTKAEYVYILDPWWNPAVEAQAIDRTHRIGQQQKVFAYKMICKDTIEEKILKLQERKKDLSNEIIQIDENVLKSLKKADLMALFD